MEFVPAWLCNEPMTSNKLYGNEILNWRRIFLSLMSVRTDIRWFEHRKITSMFNSFASLARCKEVRTSMVGR